MRIADCEMRIAGCRSQMGFTLIELTIAFTLLALILMIAYGAFYVGHRAVEKGEARLEETQRLRTVQELVGSYIRSAHPYRFAPNVGYHFFGADKQLAFISGVSVGLGGRGFSEVIISWNGEGEAPGDLTLEERVPPRSGERSQGVGYQNALVLRQSVRDFRIDYMDRDPMSGEERWLEKWDGSDRNSLPRAVRLAFREKDGAEVEWLFPIMMSVLAPQ